MSADFDYTPYRVLVVDDRKAMRTIVRTILSGMGFKDIEEAGDGREALDKIRQARIQQVIISEKPREFHLIIADWVMPNMDGMKLLEEVRNDITTFHLPFLMLTAENDLESVTKASDANVTDYIIKPFSARILEEKIRQIFKTRTNR